MDAGDREITFNVWTIKVAMYADTKRENRINFSESTNRWVWGKEGIGAVVMPNMDKRQN